ncbi:MAG: hypothetical protein NT033_05485 [Candidatus Omnitrophica bacterium]|nr:hypothetical protein [Candidatus Omnitrophota bacterium]
MNNWDNPIELYLPKNLPIHDNFISEFKGVVFLKVRLANGQDKAIILENEYHYALRFSEQKTLSPKLKLIFWHREAWDELFNNKGFSEDQVEGIYINYKIENPPSHGAANEEYDASRIEPGVYTGNW